MSDDPTEPRARETAPFASTGDGAGAPAVPQSPADGGEDVARLLAAAEEATGTAFERARQGDVPVLIADADGLWEIAPDGSRRPAERSRQSAHGASSRAANGGA